MDWVVWLIAALAVLLVLLILAILRCVGKAGCAKRLGLNCGWMAFMPFLNAYLDGRLTEASEVQLYPLSEKRRRWARSNLVLRILCVVFAFLFIIALCVFVLTLGLAFADKLKNLKINGIVGLVTTIIGFVTNAAAYIRDLSTPAVVSEFEVAYIIAAAVMVASLVVFTIAVIRHFRLMYITYSALSSKKAGGLLVLSFFIPSSTSIIYLVLGFSKTRSEKEAIRIKKAAAKDAKKKARAEKRNERKNKKKGTKKKEESSVIILPPPAGEPSAPSDGAPENE